MTFWDNPQMIINHIRHSCVTSDDTGMCEMVIVQDEPEIFQFKQRKRIGGMYTLDESGDFPDYPSSFDIAVSPGVMGRTPKTHKNDRFRKKPEHHCKTIHWNDQLEDITDGLKEDMFEEVVLPEEPTKISKSSLLSQLLEETLYQPSNPYLEFAKFDGEGLDETCSTKTIHFFLPFLLPSADDDRGVVITICVIETATVKDVKGLVLCKACLKGKESSIHTDINKYGIWIAEDDGTVDSEFPMLDEKEAISKYGFQYLAVDEKDKDKQNKPSQKNVPVKIFLENNGYSLVKVERMDVKMRIILNKILKKRSLLKKTSMYQLRRESDDHGQFVDLDATLESTGTMTFHLVKNTQVRSMTKSEEKDQFNQYKKAINDEILSTQYKSYQVLLVRGLFASSTEVSLGIHGQKIEIDPVAQIKSHIFSKIKPVSLDVSNIAECEITDDNKTGGRALFRIYFKKSEDFKHYEFEASRHVANEIVSKIYNILKSRSQLVRAEFLNTKEKKGGKAKAK